MSVILLLIKRAVAFGLVVAHVPYVHFCLHITVSIVSSCLMLDFLLADQKLEGGIKGKVTEQTVHAQGDEPIEILPSVDDGKVSDQEENVENDYLPGDAPEHIVPSNCQPKHIVKEADSGIRTRAINIEQLDLDPQSTSTSEAQSQEQPAGASHKNDWVRSASIIVVFFIDKC